MKVELEERPKGTALPQMAELFLFVLTRGFVTWSQTVGRAVRVWWDGEKRWYVGCVLDFNADPTLEDSHGEHLPSLQASGSLA